MTTVQMTAGIIDGGNHGVRLEGDSAPGSQSTNGD